jgi:hypothetical protein
MQAPGSWQPDVAANAASSMSLMDLQSRTVAAICKGVGYGCMVLCDRIARCEEVSMVM